MEQKNIILYDGSCNLCNSSIRFIRNNDTGNTFTTIPFQSESGIAYANKFNLNADNPESVIFIGDGKLSAGSEAGLKIMDKLKRTRLLSKVLGILPHESNEFIYRLIARHRYKIFGKRDLEI